MPSLKTSERAMMVVITAYYILHDPETATEIHCELQQRAGQVVWIWLGGPASEARRIKAVRGVLREAMPWLPVSCPWQ